MSVRPWKTNTETKSSSSVRPWKKTEEPEKKEYTRNYFNSQDEIDEFVNAGKSEEKLPSLAEINRVESVNNGNISATKNNVNQFMSSRYGLEPVDVRNVNQNFFTNPRALQEPLTDATFAALDIASRPVNAIVNSEKAKSTTNKIVVDSEGNLQRIYNPEQIDTGNAFIRGLTGQDRPEALEVAASNLVLDKAKEEAPLLTGLSEFILQTAYDPTTYVDGGALTVVAKKLLNKVPLEIAQRFANGTAKIDDVIKASNITETEVKRLLDNEIADAALKNAKPVDDLRRSYEPAKVPKQLSQEEVFERELRKQQNVLNDLEYQRDYMEADNFVEIENAKKSMDKINADRANFIRAREQAMKDFERAYQYEQGNVPLDEIEVDTKPTQAVEPVRPVENIKTPTEEIRPPAVKMEPETITLYHGSKNKFDIKDIKPGKAQAGEGIFLTDSADEAKDFGENVYTVKIKPNKLATDTEWSKAYDQLQNEYVQKAKKLEADYENGIIDEDSFESAKKALDKEWTVDEYSDLQQNTKVSALLKNQGYDAYVGDLQSGNPGKEYVVFNKDILVFDDVAKNPASKADVTADGKVTMTERELSPATIGDTTEAEARRLIDSGMERTEVKPKKVEEPERIQMEVPSQFKGVEPGDQNYKPVRVGMQTQIVNTPVPGKTPKFSFEDADLENLHQQNKGIKTPTAIQKVKEAIVEAIEMTTRPIKSLKYTKENAEIYKDLIKLPKLRNMAADDTTRILKDIADTFGDDKNAFDIFERKVLLDDLAEESKLGNKLPNGWTPEKIERELQRLDDILPQSVKDAVGKRNKHWDAIKDGYISAMKDVGIDFSDKLSRENYFRHQVLEYANQKAYIQGTGKRLNTPANRGFTKARSGEYQGDINTDYLQAEYEVMAQMKHDTEVAKIIKNIEDNYSITDKLKAEAKEKGIKDWHELIPEGYTTWQPREGNAFYMAQPLGAEIVEQSLALRGITLNKIKDPKIKVALEDIMNDLADQTPVLAMGGKRKEFVVTQEIADTLDNLQKTKTTNVVSRVSKKIMNGWKRWILTLNPWSVTKYNIRNFSGDLDAVIAGNPGTIKKIPRAGKELFDAMQNGKFTPELKQWYDRGGYQSLLVPQEISQVNKMKPFEKLRSVSASEKIVKPLKDYAEFTQNASNYREAVSRYAAYLDYLDQMEKGTLKNYGASRPEIVNGLKNNRDKAFKLSNDLLGAYDEVSEMGQIIRNHLIPFYSWMEINMKRYKNLFKNAFTNQEYGKAGAMSAKLVAKMGLGTAKKLVAIFGVTGAMATWNQLMYPELEDTLPDDVRARPHLIFGKDDKGNTIYFSRLGSLNDFLEWFGVDNIPQDMKDILNGKMNIQDLVTEMLKAPVNKIAGSVSPVYKTTAEIATGQKLYPDVFKPMPMRDRMQYVAQALNVKREYDLITGKPSRPYFNNLADAITYRADPEEQAYYSMLNEKRRFQDKKGNESNLFFYTKKSNALYNWKLAIKYGDKKAEDKYIDEYFKLGGTIDGINSSLKSMAPLHGLSNEEIAEFVDGLNEKDKARLDRAYDYYYKTLASIGD